MELAAVCVKCPELVKMCCPACDGSVAKAKPLDMLAQARLKVDKQDDRPGNPNDTYVHPFFDDCKFPFCVLVKFSHKGDLGKVKQHFNDSTQAQRNQAMLAAACKNHLQLAKWLIEKGADVSYQTPKSKKTAAHLVADYENSTTRSVDVFTMLLDAGLDINVCARNGGTLLHECLIYNFPPGLDVLLPRGADVHATNDDGDTLLYTAVYYSRAPYFKYFLGPDKCNLNRGTGKKGDYMWNCPLLAANGHVPSLRELVKLGVDKELVVKNDEGHPHNALHMRANAGDIGAVKVMVEELGFNKATKMGRRNRNLLLSA